MPDILQQTPRETGFEFPLVHFVASKLIVHLLSQITAKPTQLFLHQHHKCSFTGDVAQVFTCKRGWFLLVVLADYHVKRLAFLILFYLDRWVQFYGFWSSWGKDELNILSLFEERTHGLCASVAIRRFFFNRRDYLAKWRRRLLYSRSFLRYSNGGASIGQFPNGLTDQ
jgi:hypothetical protein